jgi:hypothetical protein
MAIIVEGLSVIIKDSAIKSRFKLYSEFIDLVPNGTYVQNNELHRVSFMSPLDVKAYVNLLQMRGLKFIKDGEFVDIAVVDMLHGPTEKCPWLGFSRKKFFEGMDQFARSNEDFSIVWYNPLPGVYGIPCDKNGKVDIVAPANWTPDNALDGHKFVPIDKIDSQLIGLGNEDDVEKYWYAGSGEIVYVGRPVIRVNNFMSSKFKKLWKKIRHRI